MSDVFNIAEDVIEQGTQVICIRDYKLASLLFSVGIPLRKDPPFTHVKKKDGTEVWTYNFFPCTPDGDITAGDCIKAWKQDLVFIEENPTHPITFALAMAKNLDRFAEHARTHTPMVGFAVRHKDLGRATLLVKEGSRKHRAALDRKFKQL